MTSPHPSVSGRAALKAWRAWKVCDPLDVARAVLRGAFLRDRSLASIEFDFTDDGGETPWIMFNRTEPEADRLTLAEYAEAFPVLAGALPNDLEAIALDIRHGYADVHARVAITRKEVLP